MNSMTDVGGSDASTTEKSAGQGTCLSTAGMKDIADGLDPKDPLDCELAAFLQKKPEPIRRGEER